MIEEEQNKHDDRELRRSQNLSTHIDADDVKYAHDDHKSQSNASLTTTAFINDNNNQQHQAPLDINAIADDVEAMKYFEGDNTNTIKQRLKRSIKKAKKGQWRKADAALGDGAIVDLNINDNWTKTQSKFPASTPITPIPTTTRPKWHLKQTEIAPILNKLPQQRCGGNSSIINDILFWAINNNNIHGFQNALSNLARTMNNIG